MAITDHHHSGLRSFFYEKQVIMSDFHEGARVVLVAFHHAGARVVLVHFHHEGARVVY